MSKPGIGALRRRVALLAPVRATDGGGGVAVTWSQVSLVWAQVRALSGTEQVVADSLQGRVTHEFTIRKRLDIGPANRLAMAGRIFTIWAVLDRDGPEPFIRIQAEERMQ